MKHPIVSEQQLGQLLLGARQSHSMTQAQLARQVGISQARLSVLELHPGRLTVARLLNLLNSLGLSLYIEDSVSTSAKIGKDKASNQATNLATNETTDKANTTSEW